MEVYECSVVIPVRNGEAFLADCIKSVLEQDTASRYEIIIINDHSTDRTHEISNEYAATYENIRSLDANGEGIASALNQGILAARSEIIVRMDADDLMVPTRLSAQLAYLGENHECVLVGGQIKVFGNAVSLPTPNIYPSLHSDIIRMLTKGNAFAHPTVAFKRDAAISVGLYDSKFDGAEDYELWTRLARKGKLHNLDQVLVKYRIHENQVTKEKIEQVQKKTYKTQIRWLFLSETKDWNLPFHKVLIYRTTGSLFLLSRVSRDLLVRLKNAN